MSVHYVPRTNMCSPSTYSPFRTYSPSWTRLPPAGIYCAEEHFPPKKIAYTPSSPPPKHVRGLRKVKEKKAAVRYGRTEENSRAFFLLRSSFCVVVFQGEREGGRVGGLALHSTDERRRQRIQKT